MTKLEVFKEFFEEELLNGGSKNEVFNRANDRFSSKCGFKAYSEYRSFLVTLKKAKDNQRKQTNNKD